VDLGAEVHQFDPPRVIYGGIALPIVDRYPTYRLVLLALSIVIGVALVAVPARAPRVGMMIRAGVDDRAMLGASGVNVQLVFAITFAIGAGLAGFGGVVGATALSITPGEDTRYLLASSWSVIVGGMGSIPAPRLGALLIALAEQYGVAYAPTYGSSSSSSSSCWRSPSGRRASSERSDERGRLEKGMNTGAAGHAWSGARHVRDHPFRPDARLPAAPSPIRSASASRGAGDAAALPVDRLTLLHLPDRRPVARARLIALSLMFLAGYGGMVSPVADDGRGSRGLHGRDLRHERHTGGRGAQLAVVARGDRGRGHRDTLRRADRLALGAHRRHLHDHDHARRRVAFYYLVLQNYSVFSGFQGFQKVHPPVLFGIDWRSPVPFYYLALFWALAGYFGVKYVARAPFGLALQGIRDNARRMRPLGFDVTRTASRPTPPPARSPPWAASCSPGTAGSSRRAASAPTRSSTSSSSRCSAAAAPDRPLHRRDRLRAAAELRDRPREPRALQPRDRHRFPADRPVFPRRPARPVGAAARAPRSRSGRAPLRAGAAHRAVGYRHTPGGAHDINRRIFVRTARAAVLSSLGFTASAQETIKIGVLATLEARSRPAAPTACAARSSRVKERNDMAGGKKVEMVKASSNAQPNVAVEALPASSSSRTR
jgi:ABC-type branched-subunit amino acid transport system permease subunit